MLILAMESTARTASVALMRDGRLIAEYFQDSGLTHSATLAPMAEDILKNTGSAFSDLGMVAVSRGPGSFTGVRIGVAAAKGLCWALGIPGAGVSALAAAAYGAAGIGDGAIVCAVMDARRGQFYNALFEVRGGRPQRLCGDRAVDCTALALEARGDAREWVLTGDGACACRERFEALGVRARLAPEPMRLQRAYGVALAAMDEEPCAGAELNPVYLRLPQAERERLKREADAR